MRPRTGPAVTAAAALLALAALLPAPAAAGDDPAPGPATVRPGGVVRWSAPGTTRCAASGKSWEPIGDTCWYPIDLLREPGPIAVERTAGGASERATVTVGPYPYDVQHLDVPDSQVNLSRRDQARVKQENARVGRLWSRGGKAAFTLPLRAPLADLPEGGRFGSRRFFNGQARSPHSGADYKAPPGTPVLAAAAGEVALAEDHFFSGKSVFIDHGGGLITMYFHLSRLDVKAGERVEAGDPIGAVGSSGRSTGPHLHFGIRWLGARVDPALLLGPVAGVASLD